MNIYQKLIEVRKTVPYLQKENRGQQYQYVSSSQTLSAVRAKMDELWLMLVPRVTGHNVREKTEERNDGKVTITYFTELDIEFCWVNAEKPDETVTCPWYGQGVDIAGEKGVGKALTYAEKYFLLKTFNIATDKDDPDSFQEKTSETIKNGAKAELISSEQAAVLRKLLPTPSGVDEASFCKTSRINRLEDLHVARFEGAKKWLAGSVQ